MNTVMDHSVTWQLAERVSELNSILVICVVTLSVCMLVQLNVGKGSPSPLPTLWIMSVDM